MHKPYKAPSTLYLAIGSNTITGIIEKHGEEKERFEYDFSTRNQNECILHFCYYYGKYAPFNIAGKNNTKLYGQMLSFFRRDKEQLNYFFNTIDESLNVIYKETFNGFVQCEFIRDKLKKVENVYFLDSTLEFGKYKGKSIRQIMSFDTQYIKYLIKSGKNFSSSVLNIFN